MREKVRISTYLVCMYVPIMSRYSIKKEAAPRDHILELSTPLSDIFIPQLNVVIVNFTSLQTEIGMTSEIA